MPATHQSYERPFPSARSGSLHDLQTYDLGLHIATHTNARNTMATSGMSTRLEEVEISSSLEPVIVALL
jgi:hypothetical protein